MEFEDKQLFAEHIEEPVLEFGHGQTTDHPKDGLFLYGPRRQNAGVSALRVGVIGTPSGLSLFRDWANEIMGRIQIPPPGPRDKEVRLHLSAFPGLQEAFGISLDPDAFTECEINEKRLETVTRIVNQHEAVSKAADIYVDRVRNHAKNEEQPIDIWIFVVPEFIFERCRRQSRRQGLALEVGEFIKSQKAKFDAPLFAGALDVEGEQVFEDIPDFHRHIKAKLLDLNYTSQLVRETTLKPENFLNLAGHPTRRTQDRATIAWNFCSSLFYKTQADPPWKIANMRPGVCYVGLVFKVLPDHEQGHACCAAQMFLSEGDGVVFRGAVGPWKTEDKTFHLSADAANKLMRMVLETYKDKHGQFPSELFIHGRTSFRNDEWDAFCEAAPPETNIVGVRIRSTTGEMKLFRDGDYPCLRGTALILDERNAYLWSSGFAPRIGTYIGPETPNPLFVTILKSSNDAPEMRTVLQDILGLTKINYNSCNYNDGRPVTIQFADKVGDILIMGSAKNAVRQPFKFYI
ncbi:argonaute/piwi family protein [Henriciella algicola]|uniref:Piwi domain-containing protein n=1 Tax=Henriciella algicola TaxID=1608422 RepID=A0A399RK42_9PROT|nr:hypothetical protein [Henriciella algicola]RIJ31041.1 hypothetical protein D1222_01870 [Henriciella algicola]